MNALAQLPEGMDGFIRPVGYMAKRIKSADMLKPEHIREIYSVSGHISPYFMKNRFRLKEPNPYWLFNSPTQIQAEAESADVRLDGAAALYYEAYSREFVEGVCVWQDSETNWDGLKQIAPPMEPIFRGFDAVTYCGGNDAECSTLSCNYMAHEAPDAVNAHCLFDSFKTAVEHLEKELIIAEPGPYRLLAVYTVRAPWE